MFKTNKLSNMNLKNTTNEERRNQYYQSKRRGLEKEFEMIRQANKKVMERLEEDKI